MAREAASAAGEGGGWRGDDPPAAAPRWRSSCQPAPGDKGDNANATQVSWSHRITVPHAPNDAPLEDGGGNNKHGSLAYSGSRQFLAAHEQPADRPDQRPPKSRKASY